MRFGKRNIIESTRRHHHLFDKMNGSEKSGESIVGQQSRVSRDQPRRDSGDFIWKYILMSKLEILPNLASR